MKKRLKITEGKAEIYASSGDVYDITVNGKIIAVIIPDPNDAELIADAFNTANETQLLPSELKEQRDFYKQAYDLAIELNRTSPCDPDITDEQIQAHKEYHSFVKHNLHIINKIKDNE